ncbi:hypothetical protein [Burkholderia sp. SIMBA_062]|uniref:hypothetical protein n=1 Tax=Burkholderia sp. SIMBA_062 TaxID=3085803 RepID=UPI00397C316D
MGDGNDDQEHICGEPPVACLVVDCADRDGWIDLMHPRVLVPGDRDDDKQADDTRGMNGEMD